MVFKDELAVKRQAKDDDVGLARIENPAKTKSPWGGLTVLDLLTPIVLVLLGCSIIRQRLHHS